MAQWVHPVLADVEQLALNRLEFQFDRRSNKLMLLEADIAEVTWQNPHLAVQLSQLSLSQENDQILVEVDAPIRLKTPHTEQLDYVLQFNQPFWFELTPDHQAWRLTRADAYINQAGLSFEAGGDWSGQLRLDVAAELETMDELKTNFLPYGLMFPELEDWLSQALVAGESISAALVLDGRLQDFPFSQGEGELYAKAQVKNAVLAFRPDWPSVENFDALIEFRPFDLKISAVTAEIFNAKAHEVEVNIRQLNAPNIAVEVQGFVDTDAQNGLDFLMASPLASYLGLDDFLVKHVRAEGDWRVELDQIFIPVLGYDDLNDQVVGRILIPDGRVHLFDRLTFESLEGVLHFNESGVGTEESISAKGLGGQVVLGVATQHELAQVELKFAGESQLASFGIEGDADWQMGVLIPFQGQDKAVHVLGSLNPQNLQSKWPEPLATGQLNHADWVMELHYLQNQLTLNANLPWPANLQAQWQVIEESGLTLDFAQLAIGEIQPVWQTAEGIEVMAKVERLDLDQWRQALFEHQVTESNELNLLTFISDLKWSSARVNVQQLNLFENEYPSFDLHWFSHDHESGIQFNLNADYIRGQMTYQPTSGIDLSIDYMTIQLPKLDMQTGQAKSCSAQIDKGANWPDMRVDAKNIFVADRLIDQLSFKLTENDQQRRIHDGKLLFANRAGEGRLDYLWDKANQQSQLRVELNSQRVSELSQFLGFSKGFSGKRGQFTTRLAWPYGTSCFGLNALEGDFRLAFDEGVIEQVEPGLARLLGLLSVDSLVRRLRLDIKDVTEKGMEYERIRAHGKINSQTINIERFDLKSPGVAIEMKGYAYLDHETFDLNAEVTPAMGAALPVLAGVLGMVNPLTGVLAYAIAKTLPFINEDLITYRYQITGPWKDPEVKSRGGSVLFK